jgi:hypothetical protein
LSAREREAWGDWIAVQLTDRFPAGTVLWFHAGALYRDAIPRGGSLGAMPASKTEHRPAAPVVPATRLRKHG